MTADSWTLTQHVCQNCHGRLLASVDADEGGPKRHRCAQCGAECGPREEGSETIPICCCAVRVGGRATLRCVRVGEPRGANWPEVAAQQIEAGVSAAQARRPRVVGGE